MTERVLSGVPASPGVAFGAAWRRAEQRRNSARVGSEEREREREAALTALGEAADELAAIAAGLPAEEAAIVEAGMLMAHDPALTRAVEEAILTHGFAAAEAVVTAIEQHADAIAQIADATLAARADDVRSLGRRAARLVARETDDSLPPTPVVLIARDLGPADVAEFAPVLAGVALVGGGSTAHAAIVARSLGIPMVTGLGQPAAAIAAGTLLALDGTLGSLVVNPSAARTSAASAALSARLLAQERSRAERVLPALTRDGRRVGVLTNVASLGELDVGMRAGAEGIGLLRTELAFLDAREWPTEQDHRAALEPILRALDGRPAVVRVLDFGADKAPPFLRGTRVRGLELLLANREALTSQLRAILRCARDRDVRILLPMVDEATQLAAARELLEHAAHTLAIEPAPPLGAMIETPTAAGQAAALASHADFLSIGTNDLTSTTLGTDRFSSGTAHTYDPRVLRLIEQSVRAAHDAGITIEVCGEAASDPLVLPLLVGLGVDELSVGAARVGTVRRWIRRLSHAEASELARSTLSLESAEQAAEAASSQAAELNSESTERSNGRGESIERGSRIHALGA